MRDLRFTPIAFEQYIAWEKADKAIYNKVNKLLMEILRTPFHGLGKPEPLKHELKGYWSRRVTREHRLVYRVEDDYVKVIACENHYE